ncbi:MAG: GNAT family N-acetyltransferase [Candidatus Thorarchaeota archaeon]
MIQKANDSDIEDILKIVAQAPLENIILIADITQLKEWCDIRIYWDNDSIKGVFSLYKDLDFLAGAFWVDNSDTLAALIGDFGEVLKGARMVFMCTSEQLRTLQAIAKHVEAIEERQMVMEDPSQLKCKEFSETHRLTKEDIEDLREVYALSGTPAWTPNALDLGPFFGVRNDEGRVIAVAGVHFVSKYGAELGNIATHPAYRRKGYAQCVVAAATKELLKESDRVVLHFFSDNVAAQKLYERMGFVYSSADPVFFTRVELH